MVAVCGAEGQEEELVRHQPALWADQPRRRGDLAAAVRVLGLLQPPGRGDGVEGDQLLHAFEGEVLVQQADAELVVEAVLDYQGPEDRVYEVLAVLAQKASSASCRGGMVLKTSTLYGSRTSAMLELGSR